jgi:hypothetical protein
MQTVIAVLTLGLALVALGAVWSFLDDRGAYAADLIRSVDLRFSSGLRPL